MVVSGGVTRGRVARDAIGVATPKEMTSQAQAQNAKTNPKRDQEGEPQQQTTGKEASLRFGGLTSQQTNKQGMAGHGGRKIKIAARFAVPESLVAIRSESRPFLWLIWNVNQ